MLEAQQQHSNSLQNHAKILIIEDESGPREALRMILQPQHDIHTCDTGTEAMKYLAHHPVDLITLDLRLPGTPGHQLLADLRRVSPQSEIMIVSGSGSLESAIEGIRHGVGDFLTKPFGVVEVLSAVHRLLEKRQRRMQMENFMQNLSEAGPLPLVLKSQGNEPIDMVEFARVLASTLDGQDRYTHGHCERVVQYSLSIADEFSFTAQETQDLMIAAYLHDIGKIGIDRQIIRKEGCLTLSEHTILRSHPQRGLRIVAPLGLSSLSRSVIRHHHECWDGTGYPDGLPGDQTHLAARIVRVADAYDAMTSDRPYRTALLRQRALQELHDCASTKFDPQVVQAFVKKLEQQI